METRKIETLLCAMPLAECHREVLRKRLPDTEILYGGYMKTPAEFVRRAGDFWQRTAGIFKRS